MLPKVKAEPATAFFCLAYYAARETQTRSQAIQTAQEQLRSMTGAELKAKLPELTAYFDRQIEQAHLQGDLNLALQLEGAKTAMGKQLRKMTKEAHPFSHPIHWAGFICQGMA